MGGSSRPKAPAPPPPPPPEPIAPAIDTEELARQRRELDARRRGRSSLVIQPTTGLQIGGQNTSGNSGTGLSI